jgi:hypothetical protein
MSWLLFAKYSKEADKFWVLRIGSFFNRGDFFARLSENRGFGLLWI